GIEEGIIDPEQSKFQGVFQLLTYKYTNHSDLNLYEVFIDFKAVFNNILRTIQFSLLVFCRDEAGTENPGILL
ncbi:hypothetical protein L345_00168, partial [Ophiophagus hannah]